VQSWYSINFEHFIGAIHDCMHSCGFVFVMVCGFKHLYESCFDFTIVESFSAVPITYMSSFA
jgi:hypothetical protein